MHRCIAFLAGLLLLATAAAVRGDDVKPEQQKNTALANWEALNIGEPAELETAHLIVLAPKAFEKRLKEIGALLEKHYEQARKPLGYEKQEPLTGKVAVYLVTEREHFTTFIRRIEKRRPEGDEGGSHAVQGDYPHVAAGPPRSKTDPSIEWQAGQQLAQALLARKAGKDTPLPGWILSGFGRATTYRTLPRDKVVMDERKRTSQLLLRGGWSVRDVFGNSLEDEVAAPLQGSLADYLAYGPGASKFAAFVAGFKPEDGQERKTTEQALEPTGLAIDRLARSWKEWAANPR